MKNPSIGQAMYTVYRAAMVIQGRELPVWAELGTPEKMSWGVVAVAIEQEFTSLLSPRAGIHKS